MKLTVKRNKKCLADQAELAQGFLARFRGLLGRSTFEPGHALILPSCACVHMLFMKFPIDVVFCNEDWKVLKIAKQLKPWTLSPFVSAARLTLELSAGTVDKSELREGDLLELEL